MHISGENRHKTDLDQPFAALFAAVTLLSSEGAVSFCWMRRDRLAVLLIPARIVDRTTVKDISATLARRVIWNAFFIGKTHHFYGKCVLLQIVAKLFHFHQFFEDFA